MQDRPGRMQQLQLLNVKDAIDQELDDLFTRIAPSLNAPAEPILKLLDTNLIAHLKHLVDPQ